MFSSGGRGEWGAWAWGGVGEWVAGGSREHVRGGEWVAGGSGEHVHGGVVGGKGLYKYAT